MEKRKPDNIREVGSGKFILVFSVLTFFVGLTSGSGNNSSLNSTIYILGLKTTLYQLSMYIISALVLSAYLKAFSYVREDLNPKKRYQNILELVDKSSDVVFYLTLIFPPLLGLIKVFEIVSITVIRGLRKTFPEIDFPEVQIPANIIWALISITSLLLAIFIEWKKYASQIRIRNELIEETDSKLQNSKSLIQEGNLEEGISASYRALNNLLYIRFNDLTGQSLEENTAIAFESTMDWMEALSIFNEDRINKFYEIKEIRNSVLHSQDLDINKEDAVTLRKEVEDLMDDMDLEKKHTVIESLREMYSDKKEKIRQLKRKMKNKLEGFLQ